jgi:hypothetical protein
MNGKRKELPHPHNDLFFLEKHHKKIPWPGKINLFRHHLSGRRRILSLGEMCKDCEALGINYIRKGSLIFENSGITSNPNAPGSLGLFNGRPKPIERKTH